MYCHVQRLTSRAIWSFSKDNSLLEREKERANRYWEKQQTKYKAPETNGASVRLGGVQVRAVLLTTTGGCTTRAIWRVAHTVDRGAGAAAVPHTLMHPPAQVISRSSTASGNLHYVNTLMHKATWVLFTLSSISQPRLCLHSGVSDT